jgi:hypothetical protein
MGIGLQGRHQGETLCSTSGNGAGSRPPESKTAGAAHAAPAVPGKEGLSPWIQPFRCLLTSLVMSNIDTCFLPPKTARSFSSALIMRRFFLSCRPCFLM